MTAPEQPTGYAATLRRLQTALPLAIARVASNRWLALGTFAGALLAAALAATAPTFMEAVRDQGLQLDLRTAPAGSLDLRYEATALAGRASGIRELEVVLRSEVDAQVPEIVESQSTLLRSRPFALNSGDGTAAQQEAFLLWHSDFAEHVEILAGEGSPSWDGDGPLPVLVADTGSRGLQVGNEFSLRPVWLDQTSAIDARVVGKFQVREDIAWLGDDATVQAWLDDVQFAFWVQREALLEVLPEMIPGMRSRFLHVARVDAFGLRAEAAADLRTRLSLLESQVSQRFPRVIQDSQLPERLVEFGDRFTVARGALLAVVLQILAAVGMYLVIAATLVADLNNEDSTRLRSRGAHPTQLFAIAFIASALIVVPAVLVAPLLAWGVVDLMGLVPPFDSEVARFDARLALSTWGWAAAAGALALAAQVIPAALRARTAAAASRQRRAPVRSEILRRRAVRGAFLALAAIAILELQRDAPAVSSLGGTPEVDLLAAATPAIFVLALSLVVIGAFPLVMGAIARVISGWSPTSPILALAYLSRAPGQYARVSMLLVIVGVVTVFAASFQETLDRSYEDRALFRAGAGLRLIRADTSQEALNALQSALTSAAADAEATAPVVASVERLRGRIASAEVDEVTVLVAETAALAEVAFLRDDFAEGDLAAALRSLAPPLQSRETVSPVGAERFGLWAWFDDVRPGTSLLLRLQDRDGAYWEYNLGIIEEDERPTSELFLERNERAPIRLRNAEGDVVATRENVDSWIFLDVSLAQPATRLRLDGRLPARGSAPPPGGALSVVSLAVRTSGQRARGPGRVLIDALQWSDGMATQSVANFEEPTQWSLASGTNTGLQTVVRSTVADAPDGPGVLMLEWVEGGTELIVTPDEPPPAIPGIFSSDLLHASETALGDVVEVRIGNWLLPVRAVAEVGRFPTVGTGQGLLIVDVEGIRQSLLSAGNALGGLRGQSEIWITPGGLTTAEVIAAQPDHEAEIISADSVRAEIDADPLLVAAWRGVFIGALAAVGIAAAFGMTVLTLVTVRARNVEFAILRSIGLLPRQTLTIVAIEFAAVVALGLGVGLVVGTLGDTILLTLVELTPAGTPVDPPLRYTVNWPVVGWVLLGFGAMYAVLLAGVLAATMRADLQRALRTPDF